MAGRLGLKGPAHGLDLPQHLDAQLELRSAGGRSLEVTKWSEKQVKTPLSQTLHGTAINAYIDPPNHHPDVGIYIYGSPISRVWVLYLLFGQRTVFRTLGGLLGPLFMHNEVPH